MKRSEEIQKAKDLLKSVGYHVSWWNVGDVTDNYDISFHFSMPQQYFLVSLQ